jgi:catechol 2,3-dioxygenase-like lactoylglutathione lyase family enzyme
MKVAAQGTMPHGGKYVQMVTPGSRMRLELNWYPKGSRFYAPYRKGEEMDHLAFLVGNVRKAYRSLLRLGARSALAPEHSEGTEVYVKDPDGVWIELLA